MTALSHSLPRSWHRALVLALALFAFGMSGLISRTVFERLPHLEDEVAYLFQARVYARGQLVIEPPQPRRAFWQPFVVDYDANDGIAGNYRRFGKYTPGWPLLLAPGTAAGEPWVVNALFAALNVALVFRLASELYNRDVGLVASALVAFSPMALLLNGTLMNHTSALFGVLLFLYGYWRIERGRRAVPWAIAAGIALGLVAASRPLTAVGVALPFAAWSLVRLARAVRERPLLVARLRPLVGLGVAALVVSAIIPVYNHAASGSATKNLYTLVWWYDTVGFGECCGRASDRGEGGHDVERGIRHLRFDLSLTAADLFGWQWGPTTEEQRQHWLNEADYYPGTGLSWLLLPLGLIVAFRRWTPAVAVWLLLGIGWVLVPIHINHAGGKLGGDTTFSYIWMAVAALWLVLPLLVTGRARRPIRVTWSWLLVAAALGLIVAQLMYWIGSQRYSTRYYFEALPMLAILSALPVAWLARRIGRLVVYGLFAVLLVYSLYAYSTPRIATLHGYNFIDRTVVDGIEARREGNRPVLVLVSGANVRWRALGELMALTSPFLDSDIVGAWDYGGARDELLRQFPDRQVIEMQAEENEAWFTDTVGE